MSDRLPFLMILFCQQHFHCCLFLRLQLANNDLTGKCNYTHFYLRVWFQFKAKIQLLLNACAPCDLRVRCVGALCFMGHFLELLWCALMGQQCLVSSQHMRIFIEESAKKKRAKTEITEYIKTERERKAFKVLCPNIIY